MYKIKKFTKRQIKNMLKPDNLLSFNRKIRTNHIKKMIKSINTCGVTRLPVIGDISIFNQTQKYVIVDGQHLLKSLIEINYDFEFLECIVIKYDNKRDLMEQIACMNTTQKGWNDQDYLDGWHELHSDNLEYWGYYNKLYNYNNNVFKKIPLGVLLDIYSDSKIKFRDGIGKFFDQEFSDNVANICNMLKIRFNKPAHTITGLIQWCKTQRKKKHKIDFNKLNTRLKKSLKNNADKNCNSRDDFRLFVDELYNTI
tara:strand:+ start:178 stop:942 length:765 start_codon:yes stop_codon:yes gene_type:complete